MRHPCKLSQLLTLLTVACLHFAMALPLLAQSSSDIDLIKKLGGDEEKKNEEAKPAEPVDPNNVPPRPSSETMSEETRRRIAILEVLSGARAMSKRTPDAELIVGPPMTERELAIHVLNRAAFGARPGQVDQVAEMGWKAWVDQQLDPQKIDDSAMEKIIAERFPWSKWSMAKIEDTMKVKCRYDGKGCDLPDCPDKELMYKGLPDLVLTRAVYSNRQLQEVMCEFWRNHFSIDQRLVSNRMAYTAARWEEDVIRPHVMGKFSDLLLATAHHPAMLEFLDNWISRAGAWNENYARELMELHTLGVDSYYNEDDVLALTKVLTGWTFKWTNSESGRNLSFHFNAGNHEPGTQKWLGLKVNDGYEGGVFAIQALTQHPGTAEFISYKLCRYLVNDNPPPALVRKIASVFRQTRGDLSKVYKAILTSEEFTSRLSYRAKFKTPFEYTVSAIRVTGAEITNGEATCEFLDSMGQPLYNCLDPTGYYDQAEAWLDSGVLTRRWDYAWQLVRGSIAGATVPSERMAKYEALPPDEVKETLIKDLIGSDIGVETNQLLDDLGRRGGAKSMISILLGSPDFQQQ